MKKLLSILAFAGLLSTQVHASPSNCVPDNNGLKATVGYVIDGDTIALTDNTRVRLIGLNSPELHSKNGKPQPYARDARDLVINLLQLQNYEIILKPGPQPKDQHGRSLYHVVLNDGSSLARHLIKAGLAIQTAVAPNTSCAVTYQQIEADARKSKKAIWNNTGFWLVDQERLKARDKGFRIIRDRVSQIEKKGQKIRITLAHGVVVTTTLESPLSFSPVDLRHRKNVEQTALQDLQGRLIEVRGWLYKFRKTHHLTLHHTANLQTL